MGKMQRKAKFELRKAKIETSADQHIRRQVGSAAVCKVGGRRQEMRILKCENIRKCRSEAQCPILHRFSTRSARSKPKYALLFE